ncbi:glycosyltransferase [Lactococcus insecticola]|nr:glycosyltransferase [Lactococcus insecticola]
MAKQKINLIGRGNSPHFAMAPTFLVNFFELHKDFDVTFYAFSDFIDEAYLKDIEKVTKRYGQNYVYIQIDAHELDFLKNGKAMLKWWPIQVYHPFLAGKYMPETVDRAMYFDFDILFFGDISDVYFEDFEDNFFIGISEDQERKDHHLSEDDLRRGYLINNGIIILNVAKLRENHVDGNYLKPFVEELYAKPAVEFAGLDVAFVADQGLIPYIFHEQIKILKTADVLHMVHMPEKNQAKIVHLLDRAYQSHKAQLQDIFTAPDFEYIYTYQRYKIKAKMITDDLKAGQVFDIFDKALTKGIDSIDFILTPQSYNITHWRRLDSAYLTSYRLLRTNGIGRLNFRFSNHFKKETGTYRVTMTVKASNDVKGFGLVGHTTSAKVKRMASVDMIKDEPVSLTAEVDVVSDYSGFGISSYNVPKDTVIDIIALRIEKV